MDPPRPSSPALVHKCAEGKQRSLGSREKEEKKKYIIGNDRCNVARTLTLARARGASSPVPSESEPRDSPLLSARGGGRSVGYAAVAHNPDVIVYISRSPVPNRFQYCLK